MVETHLNQPNRTEPQDEGIIVKVYADIDFNRMNVIIRTAVNNI